MCHEREARNSCLESCAKITEFLLDSGFVHQVDKLTLLLEQSRGRHRTGDGHVGVATACSIPERTEEAQAQA